MTDHLTESQQLALNQLRDLTNGADDEVAIGILEGVDWDVQKAAEMIFGTGTFSSTPSPPPRSSSPPSRSTRPQFQAFEIDDSGQGTAIQPIQPSSPTTVWTLLSYPLHILSSVFRFVFSILRIRTPHIPLLSFNLHSWWYLGRRPNARSGPSDRHRWVTELEEETGAVCIGRARPSAVASGLDPSGAGPSTLISRGSALDEPHQKYLPDFTFGTYEETLRTAQKECRVACIVLVSEEHDDTAEFKRSTLTNPALLPILTGDSVNPHSSFIVWGGDVCSDPEVYSAAEKLNITTFPSVAFVAMQAVRGFRANTRSTNAQQQPILTVLSRHQGLASVRPEKLVEHLNASLVPRVIPYLTSLAESQRQAEEERVLQQSRLEHERLLRQQQDRAFEDSARRDKERILRRMEEESRALQARRQEEERRRQELDLEARRVAEQQKWEQERLQWKIWVQNGLIATKKDAEGRGDLRVAVRLPDGKRLVHKFDRGNDTLTKLYAVVDRALLPSISIFRSTIGSPPTSAADVEEQIGSLIETHAHANPSFWGFELYNAYPRSAIPWRINTKLGDVETLTNGGQVVVEITDNGKSETKTAKSDDGYDTESDEE